jgi:hypothetical protein
MGMTLPGRMDSMGIDKYPQVIRLRSSDTVLQNRSALNILGVIVQPLLGTRASIPKVGLSSPAMHKRT